MNFKMTLSCCMIVDRNDNVHYLQFQRAIPDDCTCSLTQQNKAANDPNNAMILSIEHCRYKTKIFKKKLLYILLKDLFLLKMS